MRWEKEAERRKYFDEGYASPEKGSSERSEDSAEEDIDLWDGIWEVELPARRTWEHLGRVDPPKEKPFLTELGSEGAHLSWVFATENLKLIDPTLRFPPLIVLTQEDLVLHLSYLMIGISSETFSYDEDSAEFAFRKGTCVEGVTTETLESFSRDFMTCGKFCRRLEDLCRPANKNTVRPFSAVGACEGPIYRGFLAGLEKYLQGYRTTVLNLSKDKRLVQLGLALSRLSTQIQFLGRLCKVDWTTKEDREDLPRGVQLLCHLFDRTLHINSNDLYFVLVSVLRRASEPYFR